MTLWNWQRTSTDSFPCMVCINCTGHITASHHSWIIIKHAVWYCVLAGKCSTSAVNSTFPTTKSTETYFMLLILSRYLSSNRLRSEYKCPQHTYCLDTVQYIVQSCVVVKKETSSFNPSIFCVHFFSGRMDCSHVGSLQRPYRCGPAALRKRS